MNLEQVKEHFKYAKEVRCVTDDRIYDITKLDSRGIHKTVNGFWFNINYGEDTCQLYDISTNQLAEIITYIFDRGEEVEVSLDNERWYKRKFISFGVRNDMIVHFSDGIEDCYISYDLFRKLTPQSKLEPKLSELKKVAEENGMNVTVIFNQK